MLMLPYKQVSFIRGVKGRPKMTTYVNLVRKGPIDDSSEIMMFDKL